MIEFYFDQDYNVNEILEDQELIISKREGVGGIWISLKDYEGKTALFLDCDEAGFFNYGEGHDAALPVVFYLYDKHGVLFHDDCEFLFDVQRKLDINSNVDEWNTIVKLVCLTHMLHYLDEEDGELYTKLKKEEEMTKTVYERLFADRTPEWDNI